MCVVYFDQCFFELAPKHWSSVLLPKTLDQYLGANSKNPFFAQFYYKFATFLGFFSSLTQKMLKITILTSVWGAQHPNVGQNIQQM